MIADSGNYLIKLINLYLSEVDECLSLLKKEYGLDTIRGARAANKIPKQGKLSNNIEFTFHGIGYRFDFPSGKSIDFDFGYEGRTDGFSVGWLINFLEENRLNEFSRYSDISVLKYDFKELEMDGVIVKSKFPHDNLYYLGE